jgi:hypothetical protein
MSIVHQLRWTFCAAVSMASLVAGASVPVAAQSMDVSFIPADAVAAVVLRPRLLLTSPQAKLAPIEVLSAVGKQQAGIDPLDVEQAVVVVDKLRNPENPPEFGVILRLTKPYQQGQILPAMFGGGQPVQAGAKTYVKGAAPPLNTLHMANDRTVILATEPMMQQMLAVTTPTGHLATLLQKTNVEHHVTAIASVDAMRAEVNALMAQGAQQVPPPFNQFLAIPQHTSAIALRTSLSNEFKLELILLGLNDQSAQELERLAKLAISMGKEAALNAATQQAQKQDPNDPVQQAMLQYTQRMADHYAQMLQPKRTGRAVMIAAQSDSSAATMGIAVALLLPAVQAARNAAQRTTAANDLKEIGLAFHNFADTFKQFPTDIVDEKGNRLLSWRVRLLPFMGQEPLFRQFRQNEPWDSEHNLKLLAQMPDALKNPLVTDPTATVYLMPRGPGMIGEDGKTKLWFADVTDGTSNTILVVEANAEKAVPWTKPDDLQVDPQNPMAGLGGLRPTGLQAVFVDGSVRTIPKTFPPDMLRALFTRGGGEVVTVP